MAWERTTRRAGLARMALTLVAFLMLAEMALPTATRAQEPVAASALGETPTTGGLRPGPVGLQPPVFRKRGAIPIAIRIEKAEVDAQVEQQEIIDGVMQNPSGPFVVSWYRATGRLGEDTNIVMAGHLDYWDVGEAVFYHVWKLQEGDLIEVIGEDGQVYRYEVEWIKNYRVAELGRKAIQEIVGKTKTEKLTLITCGGPFDYERGEYEERIVIRATRVD